MCVTDRHDMTLAVKLALNFNTTNQPTNPSALPQIRYFHHMCLKITIAILNLSHNNPCFQCNTAITNFLVSHTCEIRFHDVIGQSTGHMYFYAKILKHGCPTWPNEYVLDAYFSIQWIQLCDKKNLTFVDCCDRIYLTRLEKCY